MASAEARRGWSATGGAEWLQEPSEVSNVIRRISTPPLVVSAAAEAAATVRI